jgi:hypothetical protein
MMPKYVCSFVSSHGMQWDVALEAENDTDACAKATRIAPPWFHDCQPKLATEEEYLQARRLTEAETIQASHIALRSHLKLVDPERLQ